MNVRIACNYWRLYRSSIAGFIVLACMMAGILLVVVALACRIGWLDLANWNDLIWSGIALMILSAALLACVRQSARVLMLKAYGFRADQQKRFTEAEFFARLQWKFS